MTEYTIFPADSSMPKSATNTTDRPGATLVVLTLLGLLILILLPGALYGCVRVSISILSEKKHHLKSRTLTKNLSGSPLNA